MTDKNRTKTNIIGAASALTANILLCVAKFVLGTLFGNISISADAINNLSDAGNNVIALISSKIAAKPADKKHPFGHERMEYVAGTLIGFVIIVLGIQLAIESVKKIILNFKQPYLPQYNLLLVIVLAVSVALKFAMFVCFNVLGKKRNLPLFKAMAVDSVSDTVGTAAILAASIIGHFAKVNLDGYMGLLVSVLIFVGGIKTARDTLDNLIGVAPTQEEKLRIKDKILSYDGVLGVHDLTIHDYGPQKRFVTAHAEVDANTVITSAHELADAIERDFFKEDGIELLIHVDPIVCDDKYVNEKKSEVEKYLGSIFDEFDIHDFRVVYGSRNRVLFDLAVPFGSLATAEDIKQKLNKNVDPNVDFCITIDYR